MRDAAELWGAALPYPEAMSAWEGQVVNGFGSGLAGDASGGDFARRPAPPSLFTSQAFGPLAQR